MIMRRDAIKLMFARMAAMALPQSGGAAPQFAKGAIIRTVLKDVSPGEFTSGTILFHEHMSLAPDFMPRWIEFARATPGSPFARAPRPAASAAPAAAPAATPEPYFMRDAELMTAEMSAAAKEGIVCIADQGHPDMGRDLEFLKRISRASGMPIIAGCGYYTQPFFPPEIAEWSEEQIAKELIRQAKTEPVGVIGEIGTWDVMTPDERKVFRAVAKVHQATGLAIVTHTNFGKGAMEQLDVLEAAGVKADRVCIGHVGGLNDPQAEVPKALAKRGAYVGFDRQGNAADGNQVKMVLAMIEAGYADRLLFSSDFSNGRDLKRNGGSGYAKTVTVFAPKLREAGLDGKTLERILLDNPRRLLAFVPAV